MEARFYRAVALLAAISTMGASQRSANFIVSAPTPEMAAQISQAAEDYRRDLAIQWLGKPMPTWSQPCPIEVQVGPHLGAGGATSFLFERGEVYGWRMNIQGSLERVLDSVLPHEVTHTIFATHFRRPLPRWADEGACTTVEHASERMKQQTMLVEFLKTGRGIPFSRMFVMKEYPHDVMPLYSQGYSLARYLIAAGGRQKFLNFLSDGMQDDNWARAMQRHYGYPNLAALQTNWLDWVRQGSPAIDKPQPGADEPLLAAAGNRRPRPDSNLIYRGQDSPLEDATPGPASEPGPLAKLASRASNAVAATVRGVTPASASEWHVPNHDSYAGAAAAGTPAVSAGAAASAVSGAGGNGAIAGGDRFAADGAGAAASSLAAGGASLPATAAGDATGRRTAQASRQKLLEWSRPSTPDVSGGEARLATDTTWR